MSIQQHRIPVLPHRPQVRPLSGKIQRSYPVGKQNFSRAVEGQVLNLSITIESDPDFNSKVLINLITTMNSADGKTWGMVPFSSLDSRTWVCQVRAAHPGLHSFRAEFSLDNGTTWIRDNVADAWVFVDPPQVDGLRLYTLIPNVSGTFSDWAADLKRIKNMGFNAVHLLPLTMLDTSQSPYSAKDLFYVDMSYVSPDSPLDGQAQLEAFVEAARQTGIRLCFDLVLNHVGVHSNIAMQAPDWIVPDPSMPDGFQRARFLNDQGWQFWDDLILINYEHPSEAIRAEIWSYMISYALFWARYANETGGFVRFDNLHSSNPAFIKALTEKLHQVYPEVGILAEYFTDETTLLTTGLNWKLNLKLATPWDYKFVPKLREYLKNVHRLSRNLRFFMPVTSHDSGSPAQEFGNVKSTVPRYVAAALLGTGATGIVQGVEWGIERKIEFIGKADKMPIPTEPQFEKFLTRVNTILANNQAFRHGGNCRFVDNGHPAIIAAVRKEPGADAPVFLVVCNFDILGVQSISIDFESLHGLNRPVQGVDLLSGEFYHFHGLKLHLHMSPCSALVLKFSDKN